ncbi:LacI family DNA-binding transcriptional regulator [Shimia sp. R10_1]|uniref:LacI family DNA-binding transcriptional regulator n=1 Tax=Shimia sp. R10_1 TaxID=2821095 RepID=UPI001ADB3481|nr:LacI family DNA-binding transcriptional regulator [Shimia sp. R10_1]MBO9475748.1 LacI family DNA-binding transcriptional regulator [Shimia sp. R10_1]
MTHRFPIKEIARQAGLGPATIDRVLNNRAHVSPQTRLRVKAAIEELEAQEAQLTARGRRLFFDFVVEAPARFSREVKAATESVLPEIGGAVCRPRFTLQEMMEPQDVVAILRRIAKRGSDGVVLKVRDTPNIREALALLRTAEIPVVTLVTDITGGDRQAYVGVDNAGAGRTAAFLMAHVIQSGTGTILATRSHEGFSGEEAREEAFQAALAARRPELKIVSLQGGSGVDVGTSRLLADRLSELGALRGVYSMGGGNRAILSVLGAQGLHPEIYVAHDLDRENRDLLCERRLSFVLHHDLRSDIRNAFKVFLSHHRLSVNFVAPAVSTVQVLTPENVPELPTL